MKNHYLNIEIQEDGKIYLSASDGVFSYSATCENKEEFLEYCNEKVDRWLNSTWGNFDGWTKQKRQTIAHKWSIAKNKLAGRYNYYFNFGSKKDIFRKEVAEIAKTVGIENYELIIK